MKNYLLHIHLHSSWVTSVTANNYLYHCGIPGVKKLSGEDEDIVAFFAVVVATAAAASTTIITAAANYINTKEYVATNTN